MPKGWTAAPLGELAQVSPEQLGSRTDPNYTLEYLDIAAIEQPGVIGPSRSLRFGDAPSRARRCLRSGDILVSTVRPYLRNFARIRESTNNLVASIGYAVVRPGDRVDGCFLYQHLMSDGFVDFLKPRMRGSNYPAVRGTDVEEYTLSLPPLPEQRKIAAVLSSVDDAIEKTRAVIVQVQVVKRDLMQELLMRGVPGRHSRFKQTEIGEIPEDWEVTELASIATIERGKFAHRPRNDPRLCGGRYPFIETGDVAACDGLITTHDQTLNEKGLAVSKLFPAGTIVVTIAANIGSTGITTFDVAFPDSLIGIQAGPRVDTRFLELALRTRKRDLNRFAPESAQKNINIETLRPLKVPLPGIAEQRQIARLLWSISHYEKSAQSRRNGVDRLKAGLMSVLLTGELRVTPDTEAA